MKKQTVFNESLASQRGGMLVELLLTLALVAIILPFIFRFQGDRIENAKNIATEKKMESVKIALEKYIDFHKKDLLSPVGKNITRVKIFDLKEYGLSEKTINEEKENIQIRILKSNDKNGGSGLQGLVILSSADISPIRTRKIANIGGSKMGFIEKDKAFGAFGTWHTDTVNFGINNKKGLIKTTDKKIGYNQYLWRLPSKNENDSTMQSQLNLGKHSILNSGYIDSHVARFEEILYAKNSVFDTSVFETRTTIDNGFVASSAVVSGSLASDYKDLDITNTLSLSGTAKFSSFTADELWVMDLNLSGLSVSDSENINTLKVNKTIDMTAGHIKAMYTTVNYTGSMTSKLVVSDLIQDSSNENYYWNLEDNTANFYDVTFMELNRISALFVKNNPDTKTVSGQLFNTVAKNENATVTDFINVINKIQTNVRAKYSQLNLE